MHILVIGDEPNLDECRHKFGADHHYTWEQNQSDAKRFHSQCDAVFDFAVDQDSIQMGVYGELRTALFLNAAKISLRELNQKCGNSFSGLQFGFAGLPTFLDREILEVSLLNPEQRGRLEDICNQLNTPFEIVDDRVGMVTPRVIGMIINEAYYTVQEGTATREDIDLAMKLGTNYPFGPFEWCQKIGVHHVYELLEALYKDTKDERYKICPLLKKEYMLS